MISSKRFLVMKGCQEISKKYFLLGKYFSEKLIFFRKLCNEQKNSANH